MELGIILGTWDGSPTAAAEILAVVQEAERVGYSIAWVPELYGADAVSVMAWLASKTDRIRIGSAVMQIPARPPTTVAMTAATLVSLFGPRIVLGLGISGPQVTEGWYGMAWDDPLGRTREYLDVLKMALERSPVDYRGAHVSIPRGDGYRPIRLLIKHHGRVPVYLAAIGPANVRLAGERADGWLPALVHPEMFDRSLRHLADGAARAGRDVKEITIACSTGAILTDDIDVGRNIYRPYLGLLIGGMGTRDKNYYRTLVAGYGYAEESEKIADDYLAGRKKEAEAQVPDDLIDALCLVGPPGRIRERLGAYAAAGIDVLSIAPSGRSLDEKLHVIRTVAELI